MTEAEWLAGKEPRDMLQHLEPASFSSLKMARQFRLYGCACCRQLWRSLPFLYQYAVDVAERFADGKTNEQELKSQYNLELYPLGRLKRKNSAASLLFHAARAGYNTAHKIAFYSAFWPCMSAEAAGVDKATEIVLLRCVFGNPFRPVQIDPAWLVWKEGTVVKLAQSIYEERAFDRMPVLADALEESGCCDVQMLEHCRGSGPHARGCWVVDHLLQKD